MLNKDTRFRFVGLMHINCCDIYIRSFHVVLATAGDRGCEAFYCFYVVIDVFCVIVLH